MLGYQTIIAAANKISGIPLTASEISNSQKTLNTGPSLSLVNSTNKVIKSTLTIKIEDTEGKSLSDSYTYAGYQGESVTISYNSPNGYVLTNNVSSQVVLNGQQTITAVYAPEKIVSEQVTYQQGTSFTDDDAKNIANTLYTVPTDATVTWSAKPNTENASNTTTNATILVTYASGKQTTITIPYVVSATVTEADKISLNDPEVTKVEDTQALTDDEKSAVATAVKDANPDADISNVSVADDGTATVTFGDGSTSTIAGDKTVVGKTEADKTSLNDPEITKVEDTQALTDDEKSAVATAVKDANPDADISNVSVADDGTATVTFGDGSTSTIASDKTVEAKNEEDDSDIVTESSATQVDDDPTVEEPNDDIGENLSNQSMDESTNTDVDTGKMETDTTNLNDPKVTKVENTQALTDDEKSAVVTAVKDANPDADISDVSVADDGTATVTFGDGSTSTINDDKTVVAKLDNDGSNDQSSTGVATRGDLSGNSTSLDEGHSQLSKRASSVKINQKINNDKLPQTGNSKSITGVLIGELLTTFGLIGILRKKKNRSEK
ncbi:MAG TPA: LPXTG cell wall anchor domain-containing protein [Candidatus Limosilactobacillus faecipullorum]|nr:LPXTG cell wall anchor domain-containing protein [Candidatus Limosilactobacillus faecipullorum]